MAHGVHSDAPFAAKVPASHATQRERVASGAEPASHGLQRPDASPARATPFEGHGKHSLANATAN